MHIANLIKNTKQAFTIKPSYAKPISAIEREQKSKQLVKFLFVRATFSLAALEPSVALAGTDGLSNVATKVLTLLTGPLANTFPVFSEVRQEMEKKYLNLMLILMTRETLKMIF
jgi:hypothetical protein